MITRQYFQFVLFAEMVEENPVPFDLEPLPRPKEFGSSQGSMCNNTSGLFLNHSYSGSQINQDSSFQAGLFINQSYYGGSSLHQSQTSLCSMFAGSVDSETPLIVPAPLPPAQTCPKIPFPSRQPPNIPQSTAPTRALKQKARVSLYINPTYVAFTRDDGTVILPKRRTSEPTLHEPTLRQQTLRELQSGSKHLPQPLLIQQTEEEECSPVSYIYTISEEEETISPALEDRKMRQRATLAS